MGDMMARYAWLATLCLTAPVWFGGCARSSAAAKATVWLEQGLEADGVTVDLGHRARTTSADEFEPVVSLNKAGRPVADAMVFMQFVTADGRATLGDEAAAVYETADEKHADYTAGKLSAPKADAIAIRYRILLAGAEKEWTKDVVVPQPAAGTAAK